MKTQNIKEDDLTNAIIKQVKSLEIYDETVTEPEAHYNYYGTRGVADLYTRKVEKGKARDRLFEIKANPGNANEVVRQFQRMKKFFYRDKDRVKPEKVTYELCFTATPGNRRHVNKNFEMYQSLAENNSNVVITFRHPDNTSVVRACSQTLPFETEGWWSHVKSQNHAENLQTQVMQ